jgi:hypothetical protein
MSNEKLKRRLHYLKYRNKHGQVLVVYYYDIDGIHLGASFCNPKDFNLPRDIRRARGVGIALRRLEHGLVVPSHEGNHASFRWYMLRVVYNNLKEMGVKVYGGGRLADFMEWLTAFYFTETFREDERLDNLRRENLKKKS